MAQIKFDLIWPLGKNSRSTASLSKPDIGPQSSPMARAHGTSVDIENSVALRATPVKAQRGQCVFRSGDAAEEFQELGRADNGAGDAGGLDRFLWGALGAEIAIVGRPVGSDDG